MNLVQIPLTSLLNFQRVPAHPSSENLRQRYLNQSATQQRFQNSNDTFALENICEKVEVIKRRNIKERKTELGAFEILSMLKRSPYSKITLCAHSL